MCKQRNFSSWVERGLRACTPTTPPLRSCQARCKHVNGMHSASMLDFERFIVRLYHFLRQPVREQPPCSPTAKPKNPHSTLEMNKKMARRRKRALHVWQGRLFRTQLPRKFLKNLRGSCVFGQTSKKTVDKVDAGLACVLCCFWVERGHCQRCECETGKQCQRCIPENCYERTIKRSKTKHACAHDTYQA